MKTYSYGTTPISVIETALNGEDYPMELVGEDADILAKVVNQGIDSHLEAVTTSEFGPVDVKLSDGRILARKLGCKVAPADMLVILRRLAECGDDAACSLRVDILSTLGIEEL